MSVSIVPTLTISGEIIPVARDTNLGNDRLAIDELRIAWGRSGPLEQPTPSTARLTVLDRSPDLSLAARDDLIGLEVVIGWKLDPYVSGSANSGTSFRGRITDVAKTPRRGAIAGRGFTVAIAASSLEVDLANYRAPEGTLWPAETFGARLDRIEALLPVYGVEGFIGGVDVPDRLDLGLPAGAEPGAELSGQLAAPADVGGKDALALLREFYASTSPLPMVYNPTADGFTFAPRPRFAFDQSGLTMSATLTPSAEHGGRYVAASLSGRHLDARQLSYAGALQQRLDSRITRVEVGWFDPAASYDQRTTEGTTVDTPLESSIGRRTLTVSSIHADAANAAQLAGIYADVVNREARAPRLGTIGYSTKRTPFADVATAALLLAGYERGGTVFLSGSWLPQLGQRPLVAILGGSIVRKAGEWELELNPGAVVVDPMGNKYGPITSASAAIDATITLADIDRSVTVGDLGFVDVGAGFTPLTVLPYVGNPL